MKIAGPELLSQSMSRQRLLSASGLAIKQRGQIILPSGASNEKDVLCGKPQHIVDIFRFVLRDLLLSVLDVAGVHANVVDAHIAMENVTLHRQKTMHCRLRTIRR